MGLFLPYRVDALYEHPPVANWWIIGVTVVVSLAALFVPPLYEPLAHLVLERGSLVGLIGHMFVHADVPHLAFNMLFLWIFGNVAAANVGQLRYVVIYLTIGVIGGFVHLAVDGSPGVGASGAINGIIGFCMTAYPRDRVHVFWLFLFRFGTTWVRLWVLVLVWLMLDLLGVVGGGGDVAYWGHIGGLVAGVAIGLLALTNGWIHMTVFDKPTLLEMLGGPKSHREP